MSIVDSQFRTITCNGDGCEKTVTFNTADAKKVAEETPWIKTSRVIQTGDGRVLVYCGDECEVNGVGTGAHNAPEQKKIVEVPAGAAAAIQQAAEAAQNAEKGTKALKSGHGKLQVVKG